MIPVSGAEVRAPGRGGSLELTQDALRDWFCRKPFDYGFTAHYPKTTIEKYRLDSADKTLKFTLGRLRNAGYTGHYAIVVHDKRGSTVHHPHMMLDGRNGQDELVRQSLHPVADINCNRNGPIEDTKAWAGYMAMRALENGYQPETWDMGFMGDCHPVRKRGSRGRGRGRRVSTP